MPSIGPDASPGIGAFPPATTSLLRRNGLRKSIVRLPRGDSCSPLSTRPGMLLTDERINSVCHRLLEVSLARWWSDATHGLRLVVCLPSDCQSHTSHCVTKVLRLQFSRLGAWAGTDCTSHRIPEASLLTCILTEEILSKADLGVVPRLSCCALSSVDERPIVTEGTPSAHDTALTRGGLVSIVRLAVRLGGRRTLQPTLPERYGAKALSHF